MKVSDHIPIDSNLYAELLSNPYFFMILCMFSWISIWKHLHYQFLLIWSAKFRKGQIDFYNLLQI